MVYYECDNDGVLLEVLSIAKADKKHSHSKGNVCNKVSDNTDVIGLVDEDPKIPQPSHISSLGNPVSNRFGIKVFYDSQKNNKFVMLCPRLEEWLYTVAKHNKINPEDYNLPKEPEDLHKEELRKVKTRLIDFLNALSVTNEIKYLKSLII